MTADEARAEIVRCAMAYVFGDYPGTDDLETKADALAAMEEACLALRIAEDADAGQ